MKKSLKNHNRGLEWADGKKLCDLDFADDMALIETSQTGMQKLSKEVEKMSGYVGLRMNAAKCKVLVSECWADPTAVREQKLKWSKISAIWGATYQLMETVTKNAVQESGKHLVSLDG